MVSSVGASKDMQYTGTEIAQAPTRMIPIDQLKFDINNIRLSHIATKNSALIEQKLNEIGDLESLKNDIIGAKTVFDPLIINSDYTVIEGNRRLAACRLILKEEKDNPIEFQKDNFGLDTSQFLKLKCKVLPKGIPLDAISIYLISTHLRTKKPWQLFNRALYLSKLHKNYKWSYDKISAQCFMSKATSIKTIKCYELTINYKNKYSKRDDGWSRKYIYFWKLLTIRSLEEFRNNESNIKKFSKWIFEKKFKNHTYIKYLADIKSNKIAYKIFQKTIESDKESGLSCDNALNVLSKNDPAITNKTFKIIKNAIITIQNFTRVDIRCISKDSQKIQYLLDLENEIKQLNADVKTNTR